MINFQNASFIKSSPNLKEAPKGGFPEILLVGKSNVGKSSLVNALTSQKKLAFSSSKPGHTRLLNYYNIDNKFYLVDAPGYGYASGGINLNLLFKDMMNDYFQNVTRLKLVLFILDSRRELSEDDISLLTYFKEQNIPYNIVFSKIDKINQSEKAKLEKMIQSYSIKKDSYYFVSISNKSSIDKIKALINNII